MKANELRIGNLLTSKQWGGVCAVEGIIVVGYGFEIKAKGYVHEWKEGINFDLAPILLTEEWLFKSGFKLHSIYYEFKGFKVCFNSVGVVRFIYDNKVLYLEYVHQLQNLYFALKEKELTFK